MAKTFNYNLSVDLNTPTLTTDTYDPYYRQYTGTCMVSDAVGISALHDYEIQAIYDHMSALWHIGLTVHFGNCPLVVDFATAKSTEDVENYIVSSYIK